MGRAPRVNVGGLVYHVLNRANARLRIFDRPEDYKAFETVVEEATVRVPMRLLAYCLMPNHWHLLVWPRADGDLSAYVGWLTLTHTQRWHAHRHNEGTGHLYQGRFKSFVVQSDEHLLTVWRYVEQNAWRASLVDQAERWRFGSAWRRSFGDEEARSLLSEGPLSLPRDWRRQLNRPQRETDLAAIRQSTRRGRPFGDEVWVKRTVRRFGLECTLRSRGRPAKKGS